MTGLFLAQKIARSADIEIVTGQGKAGPEAVQRLQYFQAPFAGLRESAVWRHGQIGVGTDLGSPDPTADLIELGQSKSVGPMDNQRIGGGNIEPGFDNAGAQKHIVAPLIEGGHGAFHVPHRKLAVGDDKSDLGHLFAQEAGHRRQVDDARTNKEALAAAVMFPQQRLADDQLVKRQDEGAHRQTVDRRRGDNAQIPQAGHGHLQGARNRGRGERQHMRLRAQLFEALLVGHPEMLLLVDDDQAQGAKGNGLGQQGVGADDDVDLTAFEILLDLAGPALGDQPRELFDPHRQAGEALAKVLVMLQGQQRRRRHDRHLKASQRRHEGGPECDLGLAETHIAADQTVHRLARSHIGQHLVDGAPLVCRLGVGKTGRKFVVETIGRP